MITLMPRPSKRTSQDDPGAAAGWDRARCTALVLTPSTLPICVKERP